MSKITIDGREFELVPNQPAEGDKELTYSLKPVKAEPKWDVMLQSNKHIDIWLDVVYGGYTEDQAHLIREAVEALMEYICGRNLKLDDSQSEFKFVNKADKARLSMRENN